MNYNALFHSYDNVLITDKVREDPNAPWDALYVVLAEPSPFYDYVSYYVGPTSGSTPTNVYSPVLNGQNQTVNAQTMHVPDLRTGNTGDNYNIINEYWLQTDNGLITVDITLNGVQVYQLKGDQTDIALDNGGTGIYSVVPLYAYGNDFIPTLKITNITTSPALTILVNGRNQGIQLNGFTYRLTPLTDKFCQTLYGKTPTEVFRSHAFKTLTITPRNQS